MSSQCHIQSYFEACMPVWDPKLRPPNPQMLISGVSFHHRLLSPSHESDVLSLFRMQNSQNFWGFVPGPHWGGLTVPPRLYSCTTVFLLTKLVKKLAPPKNCWIQHCFRKCECIMVVTCQYPQTY